MHIYNRHPLRDKVPFGSTETENKASYNSFIGIHMVQKTATVYVIDITHFMNSQLGETGKSALDHAKYAISRMLHERILSGRKSNQVAVVLVGAEETANDLFQEDSGEYANIQVIQGFDQASVSLLRQVQQLECSSGIKADVLDGLVVAVDTVMKFCKKLKFDKKVYVFTNGLGQINQNGIEDIAQTIAGQQVEVSVVGLGYHEPQDDCPTKMEDSVDDNMNFWKTLCSELLPGTKSQLFSLGELTDSLNSFHTKDIGQTTLYKGTLSFGHVLEIPISIVARTREFKFPSLKKVIVDVDGDGDKLVDIKRERFIKSIGGEQTQCTPGAESREGSTESSPQVDKSKLVKVYGYGSTTIVTNTVDEEMMVYKVDKGLVILGFVNEATVTRDYWMSQVWFVSAQSDSSRGKVMFAALAESMLQIGNIIVARYVRTQTANPSPKIVGLKACKQDNDSYGMYMIQLPYSDDYREYNFAPLPISALKQTGDGNSDPLILVDTRSMKSKKAPSSQQKEVMSSFIDSMMLPESNEDNKAETTPCFSPETTFNPSYHRFSHCVLARAIQANAKLPEVDSRLLKQVSPQDTVIETAKHSIEMLKTNFVLQEPLSKVIQKPKRKDRDDSVDMVYDELFKPKSKLPEEGVEDVGEAAAVLVKSEPVPDSLAVYQQPSAEPVVKKAIPSSDIEQLQEFYSTYDTDEQQALESLVEAISDMLAYSPVAAPPVEHPRKCLFVLRQYCIRHDQPELFNELLKDLKTMGDDADLHFDAWIGVKESGINLITSDENSSSEVTESVANDFWML